MILETPSALGAQSSSRRTASISHQTDEGDSESQADIQSDADKDALSMYEGSQGHISDADTDEAVAISAPVRKLKGSAQATTTVPDKSKKSKANESDSSRF